MPTTTIQKTPRLIPGLDNFYLNNAFKQAKITVARQYRLRNITNTQVKDITQVEVHASMFSKVFKGSRSQNTLSAILKFIIFADSTLLSASTKEWMRSQFIPTEREAIIPTFNLELLEVKQ